MHSKYPRFVCHDDGTRPCRMPTFPQQFTVQRDAKRLIVQMRSDIMSTMAFVPNTSVQSVSPVGDGTSVVVLKPDANVGAVLAEFESNEGTSSDTSHYDEVHSAPTPSRGLC